MKEELEELLKVPQVAKILGVDRTHVYNLMDRYELPYVKFGGKSRRVRPSSLHQWIVERERKTA